MILYNIMYVNIGIHQILEYFSKEIAKKMYILWIMCE